MGTNFYIITKSKPLAERIGQYELTDTPDWGYEIHIAKTSCGWLPLFQAHDGIRSVKQLKEIVLNEPVYVCDEYGEKYDWDAFTKRVLQHNGGVKGVMPQKPVNHSENSFLRDPDMPDFTPVSHFDYGHGKYASHYFKDPDGYEFTWEWFA